jgi:NAD(P)-dependent dehydrogenase (short-subunit alcohol dehydrogenase family)
MDSSQPVGLPQTAFPLALVTGAAHRLGKGLAESLARKGFAIALHYHTSGDEARATAEEFRALGVPVFPLQADLRDASQIADLFIRLSSLLDDPENRLSGLRVLVNSAAVMARGDARNLSLTDFDAALSLNLRAPFLLAQQAYRRMDPGGLIVNLTDIGAQKAWTGFPAYVVSKAGLEALTRILARSFAPKVRVNAIAPGLVIPSADMPPEEWGRLVNRLPLKRAAAIGEITSALDFLLENEYITGQTIAVDGGYSLL